MHQLVLALGVFEAGLQSACLKGLAVGDRADLTKGVLPGQPHFDVIGLAGAKAHVAGAQAHHPVGQAQLLQDGFGVAGHGFQRGIAGVGVNNLHHLHLVKLVLTDQAPCIAPGAAGFRAEAGGVSRQADRQGRLGQQLITHKIG